MTSASISLSLLNSSIPSTDLIAVDGSSSPVDEGDRDCGPTDAQAHIKELAQNSILSQGNSQELMYFLMEFPNPDYYTSATCCLVDFHPEAMRSPAQAIGTGTSWTPSQEALRNIQRYCNSVRLSPELPSYCSYATTKLVMSKTLTLALTFVANGTVTVTAALWARIAFLISFRLSSISFYSYDRHSVVFLVRMPAQHFGRVLIMNSRSSWRRPWRKHKGIKKKRRKSCTNESFLCADRTPSERLSCRLFKEILELDYQLYGNPATHHTTPSQAPLQEWQKAADTAASTVLTVSAASKRKNRS
ncbi:hypothetical protein M422DRAFT_43142 [Sphaerobolus stellatus SS14]|uniref:Uncharacterized protein n=1 Tax=Sphaerobolus stellatus (strain SS14) TaxID=990650 RepID=A0A0C9TCV3_SPHS4|nr:hypothetical protein M422DRAFT_55238 [Sphaerobolus stellatus SS14]KIJ52903.1 hypothetical protein M422DRAFT_43142 [Sphaerobolus stellatus SS14]